MKKVAIGFDYGTTTSYLSVYQKEKDEARFQILNQGNNSKGQSSALFLDETNKLYFGEMAFCKMSHSGFFLRSPKRKLGDSRMFHATIGHSPITYAEALEDFTVTLLSQGGLGLEIGDEVWLTITVPMDWTNTHYKELNRIMRHSCDKVFPNGCKLHISIVAEPIAAALYAIQSSETNSLGERNYLVVCDSGGGTTDLAVVGFKRNVVKHRIDLELKCRQSCLNLGGDDVTRLLLENLKNEITIEDDSLYMRVDYLKKKLSETEEIADEDEVYKSKYVTVSRKQLEDLLEKKPYFENRETMAGRLRRLLKCLADELKQVDQTVDLERVLIVPVGGSSQIPLFRKIYCEAFNQNTGIKLIKLNGEQSGFFDSVVHGAAYYSAMKLGILSDKGYNEVYIQEHTLFPFSVEYSNGQLQTCVSSYSKKGKYAVTFYPTDFSDDRNTFWISSIKVYRKGEEEAIDGRPDYELSIEREMYTHGIPKEDLKVIVELTIGHGKQDEENGLTLQHIHILVPHGNEDRTDFEYNKIIDN